MASTFPREIRELSFVPRWSIARTIRQQYVAEHMYFVGFYADRTMDMLGIHRSDNRRYGVLRWAMRHDIPEGATGDTPGPVKRGIGGENLKRIEDYHSLRVFGEVEQPTEFERLVVRFADKLEAAIYIATELQMGNQSLGPSIFAKYEGKRVPVSAMVMDQLHRSWVKLASHLGIPIEPLWGSDIFPAIYEAVCQLSIVPQEPK